MVENQEEIAFVIESTRDGHLKIVAHLTPKKRDSFHSEETQDLFLAASLEVKKI